MSSYESLEADESLEELLSETRNIHCVGRNYAAHAAELNNEVPCEPVIFSKSIACLATGDTLRFPKALQPIHYELELVLRIGEDVPLYGKPSSQVISHIGLGIDFTARDFQSKLKAKGLPWHLSKSFQGSAYVADLKPAVKGPLDFQLWLDEELLQDGETHLMLFPFEQILAYLLQTMPLQRGDLIYTGTPEGVAAIAAGNTYSLVCRDLDIYQDFEVYFI